MSAARKMAAAAELTLLEKSLGLSKGNKYSAQGERQVRSGGGAERFGSQRLGNTACGASLRRSLCTEGARGWQL